LYIKRTKTDAVKKNNYCPVSQVKKTTQYSTEERCNFYIKMRQKLSGGPALPGHAGGAYNAPLYPGWGPREWEGREGRVK